MASHIDDFERSAKLRHGAVSRMQGIPARGTSSMSASAALGVLHKLASSPATASEALALLHELQVYQVELEMQDEELRSARSEMDVLLQRQRELYDFSPAALFTMDSQGRIRELNPCAAQLLRLPSAEALERQLNEFLSRDDARRLQSAMAEVTNGRQRAACELRLRPGSAADERVHATVSADPSGPGFMLALVQLGS